MAKTGDDSHKGDPHPPKRDNPITGTRKAHKELGSGMSQAGKVLKSGAGSAMPDKSSKNISDKKTTKKKMKSK